MRGKCPRIRDSVRLARDTAIFSVSARRTHLGPKEPIVGPRGHRFGATWVQTRPKGNPNRTLVDFVHQLGQRNLLRPPTEAPIFGDFGPFWARLGPHLGVRSAKTQNLRKLRTTNPDTVATFFLHFGSPSTKKLRFSVFGPVPGFLPVPRAVLSQNGPKSSYFAFSRPWGSGQSKHKLEESCGQPSRCGQPFLA